MAKIPVDNITQFEQIQTKLAELEQRISSVVVSSPQANSELWPSFRQFLDFSLKYIAIFAAVATLFGTLWGGGILWINSNKMIANAEERIAKLTGLLEPKKASVFGLISEDDDTIRFSVNVDYEGAGAVNMYKVRLRGFVKVGIEGPSGFIVAYNTKLKGPIVDILAVNAYGNISRTTKLEFENATGQNFTASQKEVITEKASSTITVTYTVPFFECEKATEVGEKILTLVKGVQSIGVLSFQPVFENIADDPEFFPLNIEVEKENFVQCDKPPIFASKMPIHQIEALKDLQVRSGPQ